MAGRRRADSSGAIIGRHKLRFGCAPPPRHPAIPRLPRANSRLQAGAAQSAWVRIPIGALRRGCTVAARSVHALFGVVRSGSAEPRTLLDVRRQLEKLI